MPAPDTTTLWEWQVRILRWTNEFRARYGLAPLAYRAPELVLAAWDGCLVCRRAGVLTHFGPDGSGPWDRIAARGYAYRACSENAYWASWLATEQDAVNGWIASPAHRANLLGDWTHLGACRAPDGRGGSYWICDYAR